MTGILKGCWEESSEKFLPSRRSCKNLFRSKFRQNYTFGKKFLKDLAMSLKVIEEKKKRDTWKGICYKTNSQRNLWKNCGSTNKSISCKNASSTIVTEEFRKIIICEAMSLEYFFIRRNIEVINMEAFPRIGGARICNYQHHNQTGKKG